MKIKKLIAFFASAGLLLTAMIWGFAFVVVKNSLDAVPPLYMLAFRFTIASAALGLIGIKEFKKLDKKTVKGGIIIGIFLFLAYAFQTVGCNYTTAGKNAFLTAVYVLIVPLLHWIINKKVPHRKIVIAAVMAIVGIGLITLDGAAESGVNIGDVLTLICGIFYAAQIVFIARYVGGGSPLMLTFLQLLTSAVLAWITAPLFGEAFPVNAFSDMSVISSMLYLGLFSTMLCFFLQNLCQKYTHTATSSILLSTEAVFGCLFSVIFNNEQITVKMGIGCLLMFIAILIAEVDFKLLFGRKKEVETK